MKTLTYTELSSLPTFEERFRYLQLDGKVGAQTFGFDRYLNQKLYHEDKDWLAVRRKVIMRDNGCDLGCEDRPIPNGVRIIVHHLNPITADDIKNRHSCLFDPENLICTMDSTHNAIHYGDESLLIPTEPTVRSPHDTCPWR